MLIRQQHLNLVPADLSHTTTSGPVTARFIAGGVSRGGSGPDADKCLENLHQVAFPGNFSYRLVVRSRQQRRRFVAGQFLLSTEIRILHSILRLRGEIA